MKTAGAYASAVIFLLYGEPGEHPRQYLFIAYPAVAAICFGPGDVSSGIFKTVQQAAVSGIQQRVIFTACKKERRQSSFGKGVKSRSFRVSVYVTVQRRNVTEEILEVRNCIR